MKNLVVLHLYYTDMWPYFKSRLTLLGVDFDLVVTIPEQNKSYEKDIIKDYSFAKVLITENHGRDVWPFIQAMNKYQKNYTHVLKLHSKKSKHRKDGSMWLDDIVDKLTNKKGSDEIIEILDNPKTGIIGPEGQYLPLAINLPANGVKIKKILRRKYGLFRAGRILNRSFDYGFFAGTMFWARIDAIKPIIDMNFQRSDFDDEKGQIDGTFAHALERVFCLIPEIDGRQMYAIDKSGTIIKIPNNSNNIPDWSDLNSKHKK